MLGTVKQQVQKAVHAFPGTHGDPTAARVGVVSWADLFAESHTTVADFGKLPYERPTGQGYRGDLDDERVWERASFLDPASTPVHAAVAEAMTAVVANSPGLRGVPHMIRAVEGRPVLNDLSLARMGLARVPQVDGTKDTTQARGAAGAPQLPSRLTY